MDGLSLSERRRLGHEGHGPKAGVIAPKEGGLEGREGGREGERGGGREREGGRCLVLFLYRWERRGKERKEGGKEGGEKTLPRYPASCLASVCPGRESKPEPKLTLFFQGLPLPLHHPPTHSPFLPPSLPTSSPSITPLIALGRERKSSSQPSIKAAHSPSTARTSSVVFCSPYRLNWDPMDCARRP